MWRLSVELARDLLAFSGGGAPAALLLVALGAALEGVGLVLLAPIVTLAIHAKEGGGWVVTAAYRLCQALGLNGQLQLLAAFLFGFAALMLLRAGVVAARDITLNRLQIDFVDAQRLELARRLAGARWDVAARLRHARVTHNLGTEVQQIGAAANILIQGGVSLVMLLVLSAFAIMLSPPLALAALAAVMLGLATLWPVLQRAFRLGAYVTGANLQLLDGASQFLSGLKTAVSQGLQQDFLYAFDSALSALKMQRMRILHRQARRRLAVAALSAVGGALVVLVGLEVMNVAPAELATLVLILSRLSGPATQLQQGAQQFVQCLPAYGQMKRLQADLSAATGDDPGMEGAIQMPPGGAIECRSVSFGYDSTDGGLRKPVIRTLDLRIAEGCVLGIAGPSGAGKTTLADLLAGLLQPQTGQIVVGDTPLTAGALPAWRRRISYVSQDPFLFHDTIRRNLTLGLPEMADRLLWRALHLAEAEGFVRRLDQGLDTVVGERGMLVSGGERQRLALARAVLRRPRLLILDEATSAVDIPGEARLFRALRAIEPRPTVVVIAHRRETLDLCDRVLVLADGRLHPAAAAPKAVPA